MIGFIHYQFKSYIRSLKIIPPFTVFAGWIFILYAYSGVPILNSYAVSSIAIYLVMTWVAMSSFSIEEETEKNLLFVQLNSKRRYLWGKWTICLVFVFLFMVISILYPILMDNFKGAIKPIHIGLSLYSHLILAWFGVLVGSFFSVTSFATKKYAWLSAMLVLVVSISYEGLVEKVSVLKWGLLFLPPVTSVIKYLNVGDKLELENQFWLLAAWAIVYSFLGTILVVKLFLKKER